MKAVFFLSVLELSLDHLSQGKAVFIYLWTMLFAGKRGLLPIHDFMDPEEKDIHVGENSPYGMLWNRETVDSDDQLMWVCGHCGISKQAANHLWVSRITSCDNSQ